MPPALLLILALTDGISKILQGATNKSLATAGVDIGLADEIAVSVLQATAQVKGATIDWTDAAAVSAYVSVLPGFTPIPDPAAPAPGAAPIVE